jgi:hypothetical protein
MGADGGAERGVRRGEKTMSKARAGCVKSG